MKRKLDFITNSSSVSYVGWGVYLSEEDIKTDIFLKKCFENYKSRSYANQSMTFEDLNPIQLKPLIIYQKMLMVF